MGLPEPETQQHEGPETVQAEEVRPGHVAQFAGFIVVVGLLAALVLLAWALLPDHVPAEKNPTWLDLIVANRWVIWLIRICGLAIVVMFAVFAVYFVRSIRHRMRSGHWLRSGAGLEAEIVDRAQHALEDVEPLFESLAQAEARNTELEAQLEQSNELIEQLAALLGQDAPEEA